MSLDRSSWFRLFGAGLALSLVSCGPPKLDQRPDIVLVVIDTIRADHLSLYGYERQTTPSLDALAVDRGLVFERAFAHSGWTLPSMASLLTGLLPAEHGVARHPTDPSRFGLLDESTATLAEVLSRAGYRTAAVVNNTFLAQEFGFHRGFDHYDYFGSSSQEIRSAEETVSLGLENLPESEQPMFLLLHFMEPHTDYDPPAHTRGRFASSEQQAMAGTIAAAYSGGSESVAAPSREVLDAMRALYDEEILATDLAIGRLAKALQERQERRPNWLWVTGDHGEELWDHGAFEHGHQLYGELLRVPVVGFGPATQGQRIEAPIGQVDLFRTLVEIAGGELPAGTRGVDLRQVAAAPHELPSDRPLLAEDCLYGPPRIALTSGDLRLLVDLEGEQTYLFELDDRGQNDRWIQDPAAEADRQRLMGELLRIRGSLDPLEISSATELEEDDVERLRTLGYLD